MSWKRGALSPDQIEAFVSRGFVALPAALDPATVAEASAAILEAARARRPAGDEPVVRVATLHPACARALESPTLHAAYDSLLGAERWVPRSDLGLCVVRFPAETFAEDTGWHVDAGFGWESEPDFMRWRVNVNSRGRGLLLLVLLSHVGELDAPTRLQVGSHKAIARHLAPHGAEGQSLGQLVESGIFDSGSPQIALATGTQGTVFVCHPFLVHGAQDHRGKAPRILAQPAILPRGGLSLTCDAPNAVERAIREAIRAPDS